MSAPPSGIYVPAVLFLQANEDLDWEATNAHILRLAQGGITGILVQGSNGEAQHLSHEERSLAISNARQTLDKNGYQHVLVIAGTGAQSTRETIKLCVDAKESGASHALVLTPSTWLPQMTQENILRFHREVADHSPIPTMVYNFPVVTAGLDIDSSVISELATHPNIVGTKLSCGNIGKLQRLASSHDASEFAVFAGRSDLLLQGLLSGSSGEIGALVNVVPRLHLHLLKLYEDGKLKEAMDLQVKLGHADWAAQKLGGIGGIKAVVSANFGYGQLYVRGPLKAADASALSGAHYDKLLDVIALEKALTP